MTPRDMSFISSTMKPMVATVALQLEREGRLSLNDAVDRWIPYLSNGGDVTVRDLLKHTSGVKDIFGVPALSAAINENARGPEFSARQAVEAADALPHVRRVGKLQPHSYSNANYIMLGSIIEQVTGTPLETQLRRRIWEPLGVDGASTYMSVDGPLAVTTVPYDIPRDAKTGSELGPLQPWRDAWTAGSTIRTATRGATGMITTAPALATIGEAILWDKGSLLSPAERQRMFQPFESTRTKLRDGSTIPANYGLGIDRVPRPGTGANAHEYLVGHIGALPGFSSLVVHDPQRDVTVSMIANTMSLRFFPGNTNDQFISELIEAVQ